MAHDTAYDPADAAPATCRCGDAACPQGIQASDDHIGEVTEMVALCEALYAASGDEAAALQIIRGARHAQD